jgi:hypothetical protein
VFFSGCAFSSDLTLYTNEQWNYATTIELTGDENRLLGSGIEQTLEDQKTKAPKGVSIETSRTLENNAVRYTISAKGRGYTLLQTFFYEYVGGEPITIEKNEQGRLTIVFPYHDLNFVGSTIPGAANILGTDIQSEFRLHAKQIVDSNAQRVEDNVAIWNLGDKAFLERTTIEATIVPLGGGVGSNILLIAGIVVLLLGGVGGFVVLKSKRLI